MSTLVETLAAMQQYGNEMSLLVVATSSHASSDLDQLIARTDSDLAKPIEQVQDTVGFIYDAASSHSKGSIRIADIGTEVSALVTADSQVAKVCDMLGNPVRTVEGQVAITD